MQTVVGVLRGGPSREHDVSLRTGAAMLAHLPEEKHVIRDIYIDRQGVWHDRGRPVSPERVLRQLDAALLGLHGGYGEDGEVQKLLTRFGVPYTGADPFGSYLAMHKVMSKHRASEAGLLVPKFHYIEKVEDSETGAREAVQRFHQPVIVKPVGWGSSIGVSVVGGYAPILQAVSGLFAEGASGVLVEEQVKGREAAVGVIEDMRGEPLYSLPSVEIVSSSRVSCPGNFSRVVSEDLQRAAKVMHRALGLRHYSQSDFIVTPQGVYYLETDSLPSLANDSLFSKALSAVGIAFSDFLSHLVKLALSR